MQSRIKSSDNHERDFSTGLKPLDLVFHRINLIFTRQKTPKPDSFKEESMETYYQPKDLKKFHEINEEAPELADKFFEYYQSVFAEGEMTEREKALIAPAVAHAVHCPYCIDAYTQACLEKGSNLAEMTEAVHVAAAIRGGAAPVMGYR